MGGFQILEVPRDDEQIRLIEEVVPAWWRRHIVEGIEPARTGRYVNTLWGQETMRASEAQVEWLRERRAIEEALTRLAARKAGIDERLKRSMAGARRLNGSDYGVNVTWTRPWTKDVEETDHEAVAAAYRRLLEAVFADNGRSEADALVELGFDADADVLEVLDAIEALHTGTVTKSGGGGLTVKWKDVEPTSEEETDA